MISVGLGKLGFSSPRILHFLSIFRFSFFFFSFSSAFQLCINVLLLLLFHFSTFFSSYFTTSMVTEINGLYALRYCQPVTQRDEFLLVPLFSSPCRKGETWLVFVTDCDLVAWILCILVCNCHPVARAKCLVCFGYRTVAPFQRGKQTYWLNIYFRFPTLDTYDTLVTRPYFVFF